MTETLTGFEAMNTMPQLEVTRYAEGVYADPLGEQVMEAIGQREAYEAAAAQSLGTLEKPSDDPITDLLAGSAMHDKTIERRLDRLQGDLRSKDDFTKQQIDLLLVNDLVQAPRVVVEQKQYFEQQYGPTTWCDWLAQAPKKYIEEFVGWHNELMRSQQGLDAEGLMDVNQTYGAFLSGLFRETAPNGQLSPALVERLQEFDSIRVIVGSAFDPQLVYHDGYVLNENTVVMRPRTTHKRGDILIHELTHLLGGFETKEHTGEGFIEDSSYNAINEAVTEMTARIIQYGYDDGHQGPHTELRSLQLECMRAGRFGMRSLSEAYAGKDRAENWQRLAQQHGVMKDAFYSLQQHFVETRDMKIAASYTTADIRRAYASQNSRGRHHHSMDKN